MRTERNINHVKYAARKIIILFILQSGETAIIVKLIVRQFKEPYLWFRFHKWRDGRPAANAEDKNSKQYKRGEKMEIHEKIGFGAALILTALLAGQDIREKRVSLFVIVLSGSIALLYLAAGERLKIVSLCLRSLLRARLLFTTLLKKYK